MVGSGRCHFEGIFIPISFEHIESEFILLYNGPADPNSCSSFHSFVRINLFWRIKHVFLSFFFQWNSLVIELFQALTKKDRMFKWWAEGFNSINQKPLALKSSRKKHFYLNKIRSEGQHQSWPHICIVQSLQFRSNHHNPGNICKERNI